MSMIFIICLLLCLVCVMIIIVRHKQSEWKRIKHVPGKHDDYFFHDTREKRK